MMKRYLYIVIVGLACFLSIIAMLNFIIDPGNVYYKRGLKKELVNKYVDTLLKSSHGMIQEGWNERDVKLSLATKKNETACIILGSSHVMSISLHNTSDVSKYCPSLINLGVSGASVEDLVIFSETILKTVDNRVKDTKVIIGIDPWVFNFQRDKRYIPYIDIYNDFLSKNAFEIYGGKSQNNSYKFNWLSNIISYDYFNETIKLIKRDGFFTQIINTKKLFEAYNNKDKYILNYLMSPFDYNLGTKKAITLNDGSHIYSAKFIKNKHSLDGDGYKIIDEKWYDPEAIKLFSKMVYALKNKGYEVIFLFTPYHHNVWEKKSGIIDKNAMLKVYLLTTTLAKKLDVKMIGSYDPRKTGCKRTEFFDHMHPKSSCLNRQFTQ